MPQESDDSNLGTLLEIAGDALQEAETGADQILDALFPDNAGAFLDDWYRACGFPRCGLAEETTEHRLRAVSAWLNMEKNSSPQFFIDIALAFDYVITIGELGAHVWRVNGVDPALEPAVYFRCGESGCGERLVTRRGNSPLECLINYLAPAHTRIIYNYT